MYGTHRDDFHHLLLVDRAVPVDVVHGERPLQLLFGFPCRRDVDGEQELLEVNLAAVVRIERAEDVLAELVSVSIGKETRVDFEELMSSELSVGTVALKKKKIQSALQHYKTTCGSVATWDYKRRAAAERISLVFQCILHRDVKKITESALHGVAVERTTVQQQRHSGNNRLHLSELLTTNPCSGSRRPEVRQEPLRPPQPLLTKQHCKRSCVELCFPFRAHRLQ